MVKRVAELAAKLAELDPVELARVADELEQRAEIAERYRIIPLQSRIAIKSS